MLYTKQLQTTTKCNWRVGRNGEWNVGRHLHGHAKCLLPLGGWREIRTTVSEHYVTASKATQQMNIPNPIPYQNKIIKKNLWINGPDASRQTKPNTEKNGHMVYLPSIYNLVSLVLLLNCSYWNLLGINVRHESLIQIFDQCVKNIN